jgi:plastocyanin
MPAPDPGIPPAPAAATIAIVGSSGTAAFAPNPLQVAPGHTVVWTNNDATVHQIVLGDGTMVGTINPGQSSAPVTVAAGSMTYRCTFHPSMTGTIQDPSVAGPAPAPEPPSGNPPPDGGYDDDDGYDYYSNR